VRLFFGALLMIMNAVFFVKSKTMKDGCIVSLIMNRVLPGFIEMG